MVRLHLCAVRSVLVGRHGGIIFPGCDVYPSSVPLHGPVEMAHRGPLPANAARRSVLVQSVAFGAVVSRRGVNGGIPPPPFAAREARAGWVAKALGGGKKTLSGGGCWTGEKRGGLHWSALLLRRVDPLSRAGPALFLLVFCFLHWLESLLLRPASPSSSQPIGPFPPIPFFPPILFCHG